MNDKEIKKLIEQVLPIQDESIRLRLNSDYKNAILSYDETQKIGLIDIALFLGEACFQTDLKKKIEDITLEDIIVGSTLGLYVIDKVLNSYAFGMYSMVDAKEYPQQLFNAAINASVDVLMNQDILHAYLKLDNPFKEEVSKQLNFVSPLIFCIGVSGIDLDNIREYQFDLISKILLSDAIPDEYIRLFDLQSAIQELILC